MGKKRKISNHPVAKGRHGGGANPKNAVASMKKVGGSKKKGALNQETSGSSSSKQQHQAPTIPFHPDDRILLVGEGDLSFAASLVGHHNCRNVTATVLEKSREELLEKYPHAAENIAIIEASSDGYEELQPGEKEQSSQPDANNEKDGEKGDEGDAEMTKSVGRRRPLSTATTKGPTKGINNGLGNRILYNVDATRMPPIVHRTTRAPLMDVIMFNFPHVGGKSTDVNRQVRYNQELLVGFFGRAERSLRRGSGAAMVVTLFEGEPYTLWNVRDLARHSGLAVRRSFRFQPAAYPGYRHARTLGVLRRRGSGGGELSTSGWRGEDRPARSYVFVRKGEEEEGSLKKRKRKGGESDDDDDMDDDEIP